MNMGYREVNLFPTRDANILDLLITNISDRIKNLSLQPPFSSSDHDSLFFSTGVLLPPDLTQQFNSSNYLFDCKHADFASIKAELYTINRINILNSCPDINSLRDTSSATLYAAIYRHCPRRKATNSPEHSLPRNIS